ncbi:FAD-dependent oxidoreductase [Actinocorallia aurantiaca]|uniref:FAD-binding oxidoreductase n=1 Tax=Actinocorallia aurantiaca TaxID=46204 RepID=A0ABN3U5B3_9ACTN
MSHDVGIIGAGIHGISAAFHLAGRGASTVVFDKGNIAGGPTGRSGAICRAYYTSEFLAETARDGIGFLADFSDRTDGEQSGFRRTGAFYLHGPDDLEAAKETAENVAGELVEPGELQELDSWGVAVAVWEPGAGFADPYATTLGLACAARRRGAVIREGSPVIAIEEKPRSVSVTTADGDVHEVGTLLIAAGPWTRPLLGGIGVDLPLTVERHVVALLEHDPADASGLVPYVLIDLPGGYYSTPQPRTQYLVGGVVPAEPADPDGYDRAVSATEHQALAETAARRVPARARAAPAGGWASLYDVSPDWQPVTGRVGENVFVDAGTSGHGFKLAPAWGEHVARMLLDDDPDPRLAAFGPARFQDGAGLPAGFGPARILG